VMSCSTLALSNPASFSRGLAIVFVLLLAYCVVQFLAFNAIQ
jgi:hypothetical protein